MGYNFTCTCAACTVACAEHSDDNRARIQELCKKFEVDDLSVYGMSAKRVLEECAEALALMEREQLSFPSYEIHLHNAAEAVYSSLGKWEQAAASGKKALESELIVYPPHMIARLCDGDTA